MPWALRVSAVRVPLSPQRPEQGERLHFTFLLLLLLLNL